MMRVPLRVPHELGTVDLLTGDVYSPENVVITNLGEEEAAAEYELERDPEDRKRKKPLPPNGIPLGNN